MARSPPVQDLPETPLMRQDASSRRPSLLERLFAERQVYMRSGFDGHYVALSQPLQIAVALGLVALIAWFALISYGALASYLEVRAQREALTRLQDHPGVSAALAEQQAARERAERLAAASAAEAEELRAALSSADARIQEAVEQVRRLRSERDAVLEQLARAPANAPNRPEAVAELRARLEAARRLIEELSAERATLRARPERPSGLGTAESGGDTQRMSFARQLAAIKDGPAERLAVPMALAGLERAIEALEVDLVAAKDAIRGMRQGGGRPVDWDLRSAATKERMDALDADLDQLRAHRRTLRDALATHSQPPSPAKPH